MKPAPRALAVSRSLLLYLGGCAGIVHAIEPSATLSFNRDVRPILSDKCFACHGFDQQTRKADLRLDTPEGATVEIDGVRAIVPGDLTKSEAWLRIISEDKEEVMPPPNSHKKLSTKEQEILKRWITEGAHYQKHWSFEPPQRAPLPQVRDKGWVRTLIDRFVLAGLEETGLQPAAEADRRTLARRLSLDLTGLPPKPEEVEAFVKDVSPDAYDRLVKGLMDSPQWGEHRGRYWLDAARYADTHGIHVDSYREIWPYRDWVVGAFNRNQPFDQFTVEQLAGDLLPKPTREQLIATGFHRCNITTSEGGTIDDENLAMYASDRVLTTSWVWLGLTTNCAACHDHKFDPITQKDFLLNLPLGLLLSLNLATSTLMAQALPPLPEGGTLPPKASEKPLRIQPNAGNPKEVIPLPEQFRKPALVYTPELALKSFTVPAGFHVELVAAEPVVESPVAINFDTRGNLFVVEMQGYMQDLGGDGEDLPVGRIKRLKSSKMDGVYDQMTVFADHLVMPRAVMPFGDGVLAIVPPNLIYYRDTDGDGVADEHTIIDDKVGYLGGQPEHTPTDGSVTTHSACWFARGTRASNLPCARSWQKTSTLLPAFTLFGCWKASGNLPLAKTLPPWRRCALSLRIATRVSALRQSC